MLHRFCRLQNIDHVRSLFHSLFMSIWWTWAISSETIINCKYQVSSGIKVDTHEGTNPCNKSRQGQVPFCELAILPQNLVVGTNIWSLRLVPRNQTGLNFWDKYLRPVSLCKLFRGSAAWTNRRE